MRIEDQHPDHTCPKCASRRFSPRKCVLMWPGIEHCTTNHAKRRHIIHYGRDIDRKWDTLQWRGAAAISTLGEAISGLDEQVHGFW